MGNGRRIEKIKARNGTIITVKYLSTINYTSKPLLRQTSAVVSKQRTENSNPIPNSFIPSPVSCLLSPVSTRKLILHDYLIHDPFLPLTSCQVLPTPCKTPRITKPIPLPITWIRI
ncbi:MAG: hypothetical protein EWV50_07220 [Microcystis aeruginosa Ma_MB_F_20061100_S20]|uniref:Uncharacterized protein n=1 Tax=Microcystis aeruginosa Ma_MB_F_20061100_S20D TaxID=2486253 RepID=A0A552EKQ7_MICAE|nr:MAG: hypothetical protein EWV78_12415 [Microcystis aeruginosa Ma_MB_F_20061100_S20D]TRU40735.1 MAG: hypothetical protein EWV50_07220 [Microcystis aeruginosa Ma_MB_F_20061100_S20]